jgi:hypothetical protein
MKPTISNAFNVNPADPAAPAAADATDAAWELRKPQPPASDPPDSDKPGKRNPRKSLAASLASMQADLREADFGWSLELSPMRAIDALEGLNPASQPQHSISYLVSMEQSAWSNAAGDTPIAEIADKLSIAVMDRFGPNMLVMDEESLRQLVSLCQPTRLLAVAVEGEIDSRDAGAINRAIEAGHSPLLAELRANIALEVLGDRTVVLHSRTKACALGLVAQNVRHYLAALRERSMSQFATPEAWQIEQLLDDTGTLTIRPIETQVFSTSIDIGVNTTRERFTQPANRSLIYDLPSETWHAEG